MASTSEVVRSIHCEVIQAVESYGTVNVFVICLDREGHEQNIIDRGFGLQLACAVNHARQLAEDQDIHLVVLCSAKQGSFLAGADIHTELKFIGASGAKSSFELCEKMSVVLCALESLAVPTVAILNGTTLGGGLELGLACDYRIAQETCSQIGLPEVKLGVLPGIGGCVRLPRLIGLRKSLDVLLSGNPISARKAHNLGLVDLLGTHTETLTISGGYDYKWLDGLLTSIERRAIGKREFLVGSTKTDLVAMDNINVHKEAMAGDIEERLIAAMGNYWKEFEYKASIKYPKHKGSFLDSIQHHLLYIACLAKLWYEVGRVFPAPYWCLLTTFKCFLAPSYQEAITLNSLGFSSIVDSAESKSLMGLFLQLRKQKRLAMNLESTGLSMPSERIYLVFISKKGHGYCSAFIQGLLYAGIEVRVVDVTNSLTKDSVEGLVRKHFRHSVKSGRLSEEEVEEKVSLMAFNHGSDLETMELGEAVVCVLDCCVDETMKSRELIEQLQQQVNTLLSLGVSGPDPAGDFQHPHLALNLGDPRRKNTVCVEITPLNDKVSPDHIKVVCELIVRAGKSPVLTPLANTPASLTLTVAFWSLVVALAPLCSGTGIHSSLCNIGGYSRGPLATMRELDSDYLQQLINHQLFSSVPLIDKLRNYLSTGKLPSMRFRFALPKASVVEFINLTLSLLAVGLKHQNTELSEPAVDLLCVSGLIHYPPSEGGPLNYLARLGSSRVKQRWEELSKQMPADLVKKIKDTLFHEEMGTLLFEKSAAIGMYSELRDNSLLLDRKELEEIGPTRTLSTREVFMHPLPFVLSAGIILILILVALSVFVYFIL